MPFPPVQRRGRMLAGLLLTLALGACKELTTIDPSYQNVTIADTVYTVNEAPSNAPNAIKLFDGAISHADQGFEYDVAFDLDPAGNVVIIPARALATNFASPYSVGLQKVVGSFESVLEAPRDGYRADTAMVVSIGEPFIIESRDVIGVCRFSLKGSSFFTKMAITDVDPTTRTIGFTATINRNCGFHSFASGFPEN